MAAFSTGKEHVLYRYIEPWKITKTNPIFCIFSFIELYPKCIQMQNVFPVKTLTIINEEKSILRNMKGTRKQNCDYVFFVCLFC